MYGELAPGPWFRSVPARAFVELYLAQLGALDPDQVLCELADLAAGRIPALLCFDGRRRIPRGATAGSFQHGSPTPSASRFSSLAMRALVPAGPTRSCRPTSKVITSASVVSSSAVVGEWSVAGRR